MEERICCIDAYDTMKFVVTSYDCRCSYLNNK